MKYTEKVRVPRVVEAMKIEIPLSYNAGLYPHNQRCSAMNHYLVTSENGRQRLVPAVQFEADFEPIQIPAPKAAAPAAGPRRWVIVCNDKINGKVFRSGNINTCGIYDSEQEATMRAASEQNRMDGYPEYTAVPFEHGPSCK